jgi:hypothetical protein
MNGSTADINPFFSILLKFSVSEKFIFFLQPRLGNNKDLFIPFVTYPHLIRFMIKKISSPLRDILTFGKEKNGG